MMKWLWLAVQGVRSYTQKGKGECASMEEEEICQQSLAGHQWCEAPYAETLMFWRSGWEDQEIQASSCFFLSYLVFLVSTFSIFITAWRLCFSIQYHFTFYKPCFKILCTCFLLIFMVITSLLKQPIKWWPKTVCMVHTCGVYIWLVICTVTV